MSASVRRPMGITILAVLGIISGLVTILLALPSLGVGGLLLTPEGQQAAQSAQTPSGLGIPLLVFGAGFLLLGVLNLVFGVGAMGLRSWAWPLGVGLQSFNLVLNVVDWIQGGFSLADLLNVALAVVIMWYLLQPNIRAAFGR